MDFINDQNPGTLARVAELVGGLPQYVQDAQVKTAEDTAKLEPGLFADATRREFPVDSPEATWLSAAYFYGRERSRMEPKIAAIVEGVIDSASDVWGIATDVAKVRDAVGTELSEKQAAFSDDDFALVTEFQGKMIHKYPVKSAEDVREACAYFVKNSHKYPMDWKHQICSKLVQKAAQFGLSTQELPHQVLMWNDQHFPDLNTLIEEFDRRNMVLEGEDKQAAEALASVLSAGRDMNPEEFTNPILKSMVDVLLKFDKQAGIDKQYGRRFLTPTQALFSKDMGKVAEMINTIQILDYHVPVSEVAAVPMEKWAELFGKEMADSIATNGKVDTVKLQDVIATLPDPDKKALLRAL